MYNFKCNVKKDESNSEPNLYYLSISYSDLNRYNIKDIYMIDFDIQNKKENNNINIKFELNSNKKDMIKVIGLNSDELIYENNYFKLYFDSNYSSSTGKFYIQSLISSKYSLSISNDDFDTKGYVNDNFKEIKLYENSITFNEISFHPCNENMHYIKFNYIIRDENYEKIKTEHVELTFQKAKIDTKYCLNNTN